MSENILQSDIAEEMRDSYMEYAMSVIIGRALPDVRDGLKPVHRRVLFSMNEQGNDYNKPYRKSARVVGDVIGKYHPHGDSAVYDATVRLTQKFSMRYPLVDGQGNFGSVDGDSPAAMRYTEVRMKRLAHEILADLDKETVDFIQNYDGSLEEPVVLPSKIPNLLINGSTGIAVGMACNIPPHNLTEVINALLYYIDNRNNPSLSEIMQILPGPDFPTGGIIMGRQGIYNAYSTGRGIISVRAKAHFETEPSGRECIIVTELPYMVNKANLLEKIAALVREKKIEGISDLRDESDRTGMRIYIQVKKNENPDVVLSNLFKQTALQSSYSIIMLAIVDSQPKILPIIQVLRLFLKHRITVITRRIQYELRQAEAKAHILEGLLIALDNLDEVIECIRSSENAAIAKEALQKNYALSLAQATAILDMRLHRLTGLERNKIREDYENIMKAINHYKELLADEELILDIIREESREIIDRFGDERRTEIMETQSSITAEELIKEEDMVVTISHAGYVKRSAVSDYRLQKHGGKGRMGMATKDNDFVDNMFVASTHDYLLIFTNFGQAFSKKVYELPQASPTSKGKAVVNLLPLRKNEKVCTYLNVPSNCTSKNIMLCTANGIIKKTQFIDCGKIRSPGVRAITLNDGDALIAAKLTNGNQEVFLSTAQGRCLRFHEDKVRASGRTSRGVKGIQLKNEDDKVVSMEILTGKGTLLTVTENGYGKRSLIDSYHLSLSRGRKGVLLIKTSQRNGNAVATHEVKDDDQVIIITQQGKLIRINAATIPIIGRVTQGVRLIFMEKDEKVIDVATVEDDSDSNTDEDEKIIDLSPVEDDEESLIEEEVQEEDIEEEDDIEEDDQDSDDDFEDDIEEDDQDSDDDFEEHIELKSEPEPEPELDDDFDSKEDEDND